jgi:PEGA domain-containing protein
LWVGAVGFAVATLCSSAVGQEINLKGTAVAWALGDLFTSAGKGNQRKSEFDKLILDVDQGILKCDVKIANKHVAQPPFGKETTIWDYDLKGDFVLDLNAAPPTTKVDFGKGVNIAYVDMLKTLNIGRDWCLLTVDSTPDKATVVLDGRQWGTTRRDGFMQPGKYRIQVQKTDFEPVEEDIEVKRGEAKPLSYALKRKKP